MAREVAEIVGQLPDITKAVAFPRAQRWIPRLASHCHVIAWSPPHEPDVIAVEVDVYLSPDDEEGVARLTGADPRTSLRGILAASLRGRLLASGDEAWTVTSGALLNHVGETLALTVDTTLWMIDRGP